MRREPFFFKPLPFLALLIFCIFWHFSLKASWATERWKSFQELVEATAQHNPELLAAQEALLAAQFQERATYQGFFPHLSTSLGGAVGNSSTAASANSGNLAGATSSATESNVSPITSYSLSATLNQNLFAGLSDFSKIQQARINTQLAKLNLQIAKAKVSLDLRTTFERYRFAQEMLRLSQEILRRRQDNYKLVQIRFESGRENKGSVLLSHAYSKQASYEVQVAANAGTVARAQLARTLGRDDAEGFEFDPKIWDFRSVETAGVPTSSPKTDLLKLTEDTPDLQQATQQEKLSFIALTSARSPFFPSLGISGTVSTQGSSASASTSQRWSLGATLSWAFFSGGRDYYAARAATSQWHAASLAQQQARRATFAKLTQVYTTKIEAAIKGEVDQSFQAAAVLRAEIARNKYNNGLLSFEDWDVIENDLILRQRALLQSKLDWILAEAAWQQAQGKGVFP